MPASYQAEQEPAFENIPPATAGCAGLTGFRAGGVHVINGLSNITTDEILLNGR